MRAADWNFSGESQAADNGQSRTLYRSSSLKTSSRSAADGCCLLSHRNKEKKEERDSMQLESGDSLSVSDHHIAPISCAVERRVVCWRAAYCCCNKQHGCSNEDNGIGKDKSSSSNSDSCDSEKSGASGCSISDTNNNTYNNHNQFRANHKSPSLWRHTHKHSSSWIHNNSNNNNNWITNSSYNNCNFELKDSTISAISSSSEFAANGPIVEARAREIAPQSATRCQPKPNKQQPQLSNCSFIIGSNSCYDTRVRRRQEAACSCNQRATILSQLAARCAKDANSRILDPDFGYNKQAAAKSKEPESREEIRLEKNSSSHPLRPNGNNASPGQQQQPNKLIDDSFSPATSSAPTRTNNNHNNNNHFTFDSHYYEPQLRASISLSSSLPSLSFSPGASATSQLSTSLLSLTNICQPDECQLEEPERISSENRKQVKVSNDQINEISVEHNSMFGQEATYQNEPQEVKTDVSADLHFDHQQQEAITRTKTTTKDKNEDDRLISGVLELDKREDSIDHSNETMESKILGLSHNDRNKQQDASNNNLTKCIYSENIKSVNFEDRLIAPKSYPNNTLIVDLNKCHNDLSDLWSSQSRKSPTRSKSLTNQLQSCWPNWLRRGSHRGFSPNSTIVNSRSKKSKLNYYMPESLLRINNTLKLDEYDKALSVLTSDMRYKLHLLFYRRVQTLWLLLSTIFCILGPVMLLSFETLILAGAFALWLGLQLAGAIVVTQLRKKLDQMLEKSVAQVNSYFLDHNLMLGVINNGGLLSKTKLMIPMLYFDTSQCREQIESIISIDSRNNDSYGDRNDNKDNNKNNHILDYTRIDLSLTKPNVMAFAQSQLAKKIILRYSQRWISYFDRRKLMFNDDRIGARHLSTGKCLCQFIEEQFRNLDSSFSRQQKPKVEVQQMSKDNPISNERATTIINVNSSLLSNQRNGFINNNKQQQVEMPVIPKVISNCQAQIPTLSRLVSLKDQSTFDKQVKIDIAELDHQQQRNAYFAPDVRLHLDFGDSQSAGACRALSSPLGSIETPMSSPDLSLEIGSDLISRSDELVRKLRLLLELRKNELQTIDGSLFSGVLYKTPQQFTFPTLGDQPPNLMDKASVNNSKRATEEATGNQIVGHNNDNNTNKTSNEGKRFYTQREGLFFLGPNGAKKNHQQDSTNKNSHVLEIC